MAASVNQEIVDPSHSHTSPGQQRRFQLLPLPEDLIELSDADSDSDDNDAVSGKRTRDSSFDGGTPAKKHNVNGNGVSAVLLPGFLDPLAETPAKAQTCRQFWKAGDYEGSAHGNWDTRTAFAELLDNSLDEGCNGATYVNVDMLINKKDGSRMLLIEDDGGGMDPDKLRRCMSLGYSVKGKLANAIGQYGNGFKTSTMRLGADVIVFSRSCGEDGKSISQSAGLLSYTFLRSTRQEDIVVPVFYLMEDCGTHIIIYNLWEDDQGKLELDFGSDEHDIQIRGVNKDEKNIQMAKQYPNSRHFLTYRHSLRGKDVEHHNVVNDMMMTEEVTYRPQSGTDGLAKDTNMVAIVTVGFIKDAAAHIDVQGFNVYHKNRLIKPFWRLWNTAGSDGRGVIGVLEANFVEPAHDKQGFERTTVLARLENKLVHLQRTYWRNYCHKIGYAPRYNKEHIGSGGQGI